MDKPLTVDDFLLEISGEDDSTVDIFEWHDTSARSTLIRVTPELSKRAFLWGLDEHELYRLHGCAAAIVFEEIDDEGTHFHEATLYPSMDEALWRWDAMRPTIHQSIYA